MEARTILAVALLAALGGCTGTTLEPIPGSLIYGGQPRTLLTKSPPGTIFPHNFVDEQGRGIEETYLIQPDRTLKLTRRIVKIEPHL